MEPLLAYVLYKDGEKAVVPVSLIKDYFPKSTKDLAKNKLVYWRDKDAPDGGDEDYYPGDIEELAGEMQEHLKKRKTCQCSEQQQVCNWDIPATREPELGSESFGARDLPGEGLAELAAAAQTAVEAAASSSPSPAQQMLPVQVLATTLLCSSRVDEYNRLTQQRAQSDGNDYRKVEAAQDLQAKLYPDSDL
ncbi:uncharacterized protein LOC144116351 isoform X5 [Amblyomma americanum]